MSDVTSASADALADLGLDLGTSDAAIIADQADAAAAAEQAAAPDAGEVKRESKPRQEVKIASQESGLSDFVPELKRLGGGERGSKYEIEGIAAPVAKPDGSGFQYHTLTIRGEEGQDPKAVIRSVQSAVTQYNKKQKEEKTGVYLVTRTAVEGGITVGVTVYRVDQTLGDTSNAE